MSTWVLLRGLTREAGHWGAFPSVLRERLPEGDRVIAIDLPGNGRLNHQRSPARIEAYVDDCRRQLRALGVATPVHVVAMSLGAMVTADWASRHPAELAGCVLVNTSLRPFSPWYRRLRPANYRALLGVIWPGSSPRAREQTLLRLTTRHPPDAAGTVDAWTALREARPVSGANALRQLCAAMRYRASAEAPAVPLLVLSSRCDGLVDVRCSQGVARAWRAPIIEHPTAGHDLPLDDGPWAADRISRWAAALSGGRPPDAARCSSA
ncbi:alpha/beta fold hydrolase [Variovorax ureilyticus]|uniref:alpha/beta fold hydrolase n=1 Tax=Variovorax ureilyticus TaxID=1836198 RepID=UPI003D6731F5